MSSSDYDSDESDILDNYPRNRATRRTSSENSHSRSVSPEYDISTDLDEDSELEEQEVVENSDTDSSHNSHRSQYSNHLLDIFETSDQSDNFEEDDSDDNSTMPRRSARLSGASSLNGTFSDSSGAGPSTRSNSPLNDSNDTVDYDLTPSVYQTSQVIEINDTQGGNEVNDADDDVILIPENIETIDLCTQALPTPRSFRIPLALNEVIEIEDSPLTQQLPARSPRNAPTRNNRSRENARTVASPYLLPAPKTSTAVPKRLVLDDSMEDGATQAIKINCPICLESVIGRQPMSTICGHLFCKECIKAALQQVKKCPMCKKNLKVTNVHDIYLGV